MFYVDYADTETLRARYRDDPGVDVSKIVNVNGVWGKQTLAQTASSFGLADFIVASHVIEHVPDLVTWLHELGAALKPDGEIRLAIPDRRYTFDILRTETRIGDVLAAYLVRARVPQPRKPWTSSPTSPRSIAGRPGTVWM